MIGQRWSKISTGLLTTESFELFSIFDFQFSIWKTELDSRFRGNDKRTAMMEHGPPSTSLRSVAATQQLRQKAKVLSPLRGLNSCCVRIPGAYAPGQILLPLRGYVDFQYTIGYPTQKDNRPTSILLYHKGPGKTGHPTIIQPFSALGHSGQNPLKKANPGCLSGGAVVY
jgi:hypothetical protein